MFPATQTTEVKKAEKQMRNENEKQRWEKTEARIRRKAKVKYKRALGFPVPNSS